MFRRILVPLDGSSLAEHALPLAARLAKVSGGIITLLHISNSTLEYGSSLTAQPFMYTESMLEEDIAQARLYLGDIERSPVLKDIAVHKEVTSGEVALCILDFAQSDAADLIVICSHGRTGFKRWALGSIAQKVARYSTKPVLIVNSGHATLPATTTATHPIKILVGLDGSLLAETVLLPAAQLSAALNAPENGTLHLLRVVELVQSMRDEATATINAINEQTIAEARTYLQTVEQRLQGGDFARFHLNVSSSTAASYDTADTLVHEAEQGESRDDGTEQEGSALIALATHGRGGLKRWVMGSVAERMLGSTQLPMLIVRSREAEADISPQKELVQQGTL